MQIPKEFNHKYIVDRAVAVECIYQATKSLDTNPEAVSIINKSIPILKEKNYWKNFIGIHRFRKYYQSDTEW